MNKLTLFALISLGCLFASAHLQAGAYYKWTDENGVTHYTDKPPHNTEAQKVNTAKRVPKTHKQAEEEAAGKVAAEKSAAAQQARQEACQTAKQRLSVLQNNTSVQMRAPDGEIRTLSAEEIATETERSQAEVDRVCKGL